MSATTHTEWPSTPVPQPVRDLVAKFMDIGDTKSEEAGKRLGYEVFAADGRIVVNKRSINGAEGDLSALPGNISQRLIFILYNRNCCNP
jgi:hypothetical protein